MECNEPSWISLEPHYHMVFETLLSFIDSVSADPTSWQELVSSTIATLQSIGTQDPSANQYRFESRILYGILFTIVKQLDAAAAQQEYLVKLVLSIHNMPLPATVIDTIDEYDISSEMHRGLKPLINVWSSFERNAPIHPRLEDRLDMRYAPLKREPWQQAPGRYWTAEEWTNLNAFIARLHAAAPDVPYLDLRGLFAMIEALERPLTPTPLEDVLPAATTWVIYAGNALKSNDFPYAFYPGERTKRMPWSKGELWTGQHAFNPARWQFWMQRFKEIAERGC